MYSWREEQLRKQRRLRILLIIGLCLLVLGSGATFLMLRRGLPQQKTSAASKNTPLQNTPTAALVNKLSFEADLDIPVLDELLHRPDVLNVADQLILSTRESDRYLGLLIYSQVPELSKTTLSSNRLEKIASKLQDASPSIRMYAAGSLVQNHNMTGVPILIDNLTSELALTYMEPPVSQGEYAQQILSNYLTASINFDPVHRIDTQNAWLKWWQENRVHYMPTL